ncbi:MAG TPA: SRPBCC domain-containing protein [Polyangia bacterium]
MSAIVHTLVLPAGRDAVWEAWTTAPGLARWLCRAARIDAVVGGAVHLEWDPAAPRPALTPTLDGEVLFLDRPRLLELRLGDAAGAAVTVALAPSLDGTRLTLTQAGFSDDPGGESVRQRCDAAWVLALGRLRAALPR